MPFTAFLSAASARSKWSRRSSDGEDQAQGSTVVIEVRLNGMGHAHPVQRVVDVVDHARPRLCNQSIWSLKGRPATEGGPSRNRTAILHCLLTPRNLAGNGHSLIFGAPMVSLQRGTGPAPHCALRRTLYVPMAPAPRELREKTLGHEGAQEEETVPEESLDQTSPGYQW